MTQLTITDDLGVDVIDIDEPRMAGRLDVDYDRNEAGLRLITFGGRVFTTHQTGIERHENVVTINGVDVQIAGLAVTEGRPGSWRTVGTRYGRRLGGMDDPTEAARMRLREWAQVTATRLAETAGTRFDDTVARTQVERGDQMRNYRRRIEAFTRQLAARIDLADDVAARRAHIGPAAAQPATCRWPATEVGEVGRIVGGHAVAPVVVASGVTIGWLVHPGAHLGGRMANPGRNGDLLIPVDQLEWT